MTSDLIGTVSTCGHAELAARLTAAGVIVDLCCVDAPYSDRTHAKQLHGRRDSQWVPGAARWATSRGIAYAAWSAADVRGFVEAWHPITDGWIATITDSELYPEWRDALRAAGRYVFAPIPCVQVGMNVRLAGDGPSSWTCWLVVARRRDARHAKWRTTPGAYHGNAFDSGENTATAGRRSLVVGGKPLWLMSSIVRDYSNSGGLVADPCAGAGTALIAAKLEGRRYVGGDIDAAHAEIARERLRDLPTAERKGTMALFGGGR